jgi:hypothetical protein
MGDVISITKWKAAQVELLRSAAHDNPAPDAREHARRHICDVYERGPGYCFEREGELGWLASSDEEWNVEMGPEPGAVFERYAGQRHIDGVVCQVFVGIDGVVRAQQTIYCTKREPR